MSRVQGGTDNASPIIYRVKPNGDIRICADYKLHVNRQILTDSHFIPNIQEITSDMARYKYFAQFDLKQAYEQIELDQSARHLLTINTPIGLL